MRSNGSLAAGTGSSGIPPERVDDLVGEAVRAAGNGSSTNGSSETPARQRKRRRRPETVAKTKRAKGEAYISPSTGKLVASRSTGPPCRCKKCFELFSTEEKEGIIVDFNEIGEKQLQDAHLFGLIKSQEVSRRRPRGKRKGSEAGLLLVSEICYYFYTSVVVYVLVHTVILGSLWYGRCYLVLYTVYALVDPTVVAA